MQKRLESMQKGLEDIKWAPFRCVACAAKYNGTMGFCKVFDRYKSKIEVSVSAMLVDTRQKNIDQAFII